MSTADEHTVSVGDQLRTRGELHLPARGQALVCLERARRALVDDVQRLTIRAQPRVAHAAEAVQDGTTGQLDHPEGSRVLFGHVSLPAVWRQQDAATAAGG